MVKEKRLTRGSGLGRIAGEGSAHQLNIAVEGRSLAVDRSNEGIEAPANHAHTQLAFHSLNEVRTSVLKVAKEWEGDKSERAIKPLSDGDLNFYT
jgi:hypothetical protein